MLQLAVELFVLHINAERDISRHHARITITDGSGAVVGRLGVKPAGTERGAFLAPHGIAVDSRGDIYIGEVGFGLWPTLFPGGEPPPPRMASLKKLVKL